MISSDNIKFLEEHGYYGIYKLNDITLISSNFEAYCHGGCCDAPEYLAMVFCKGQDGACCDYCNYGIHILVFCEVCLEKEIIILKQKDVEYQSQREKWAKEVEQRERENLEYLRNKYDKQENI